MNPLASVDGQRITYALIRIPYSGAWVADLDVDTDKTITGKVETRVGNLSMTGTVDPRFSGAFAMNTKLRVVAGNGKIDAVLKAKDYANDASIKAQTVVADIVREAGEILDPDYSDTMRFGPHYARESAPASRLLRQMVGSRWWVDLAGVVRIGDRPRSEVPGDYEILDFDPRTKIATVSTDNPESIRIGSVLRGRLANPLVVLGLNLSVEGDKVRLICWGEYA